MLIFEDKRELKVRPGTYIDNIAGMHFSAIFQTSYIMRYKVWLLVAPGLLLELVDYGH
jgi:hypothetical protein